MNSEFWDVGRAASEPAMPEELGNGETDCGKTFVFNSLRIWGVREEEVGGSTMGSTLPDSWAGEGTGSASKCKHNSCPSSGLEPGHWEGAN